MNTATGQIHNMNFGETLEQLAARTGGKASDFIPVARMPDANCKKCHGTGSRKAGFFSRRFKPCECVV